MDDDEIDMDALFDYNLMVDIEYIEFLKIETAVIRLFLSHSLFELTKLYI